MTDIPNENLGDLISRAVAARLDASFVEKQVDTRIAKLVVEAVDTALSRFGETGKLIEKAVADALHVERLDLPSYGQAVTMILKVQIEQTVSELVAGKLAANMTELLSLAPKEVKLSQIATDMRERHDPDEHGDVITVIVERKDRGYAHVYLDEEQHLEDRDKYKCRHHLGIDDKGVVYSATIDNRDLKATTHIGRSYGVGQKLRAYVACGTRIILDEDDVVTSIGDY